jgi:tetratricopeptide (TPR) repeat protein
MIQSKLIRTILLILLTLQFGCRMNRDAAKESYLENGNRLSAAGNWEEASINYRKAIQLDNRFAEAYYRLGRSECRRGDLVAGVAALARAAELAPARDEVKVAVIDNALSLYLRDRSWPAHDQAAHAIADLHDHNSFDALRVAGVMAMLDGRTDQARSYFAHANAVKPMQTDLVHNYVETLLEGDTSQVRQGEKMALDLIRVHPEFLPMYDVLYSRYSSTNRVPDAERILLEKVQNNPHDAHSRIQLAAHYARVGKQTEMHSAIERLVNDPVIKDRFLQAGDFYVELHERELALAMYGQGRETQPSQSLDYDTRIVSLLQKEGKRGEALQRLDAGLAAHPDSIELQFLKAELFAGSERGGDAEQAAALLNQLLKRENRPQFHNLLGRVYLDQGKRDDAEREFVQATRQRGYLDPLRALATLCLQRKDYLKATQYAEAALAFAPADPAARMIHAVALRGEGNFNQADRELTALEKDFPNSPEPRLALANLRRSQGQFKAAENLFATLNSAGPGDLRSVQGLAQTYFDEKQPEKAVALLREQASSPNAGADTHLLLADAAFATKQLALAVAEYTRAAAIDSRLGGYADMRSGDALLQMAQTDKAVEYLQRARTETSNDKQVLAMLALAYERAGRKNEALGMYRQALTVDPANPLLLNNLAFAVCETSGDLDEALTLAQKAQRLAAGDPRIADTVGWIYLKKHTLDAAIQIFLSNIRNSPHQPVYRYHLALALKEKGDKQGAMQTLLLALNDKPVGTDETNIRQLLEQLRQN